MDFPRPKPAGDTARTEGFAATLEAILSPPYWLSCVLVVQPFLQRREVIADRRGIHLALSGERKELLRPRPACAHGHRLGQPLARLLIAIDGAAIQRLCATRDPRQRAMKLKLQNVRQEVAH